MTLRRILAQNLRRLRHERRLSQEELADLAGINRNFVRLILREESDATVHGLEDLPDALTVAAAELLAQVR